MPTCCDDAAAPPFSPSSSSAAAPRSIVYTLKSDHREGGGVCAQLSLVINGLSLSGKFLNNCRLGVGDGRCADALGKRKRAELLLNNLRNVLRVACRMGKFSCYFVCTI